MNDLAVGPSGTDPTSGNYVAALDATDRYVAGRDQTGLERQLPRDVTVSRPAAISLQRRIPAAVILLPLLGTVAAIGQAIVYGVGLLEWGLLALMYVLCMLGSSVGLHRLFTHR